MNLFKRLRTGWHLGITSLEVISDHPKLLIFPVLSGTALLMILMSFGLSLLAMLGIGSTVFDWQQWESIEVNGTISEGLGYLLAFIFYFVNFFIVIFFNVALVFSAREVFEGRKVKVTDALRYAASRLGTILAWTALASTVGVILKMLEERLGFLGSIVSGLLGLAWSILTYFVVPVLAFEDIGPVEALKRSGSIIRKKWGESIGAGFSFGLLYLIGIVGSIISCLVLMLVLKLYITGVIFLIGGILLTFVAASAAETVFLTAAYEHARGITPAYYRDDLLDDTFVAKTR